MPVHHAILRAERSMLSALAPPFTSAIGVRVAFHGLDGAIRIPTDNETDMRESPAVDRMPEEHEITGLGHRVEDAELLRFPRHVRAVGVCGERVLATEDEQQRGHEGRAPGVARLRAGDAMT